VRDTRTLLSKLIGFLTLMVALFLFAATLTGGGSLAEPPRGDNSCGPLGEWIAVHMRLLLGLTGALGAVLLLGSLGVVLLGKKTVRMPAVRIAGALLFCAALAVLEHLLRGRGGSYEGPFIAGGAFGRWLGRGADNYLGFMGAFLATGGVFVAAVTLITDIFFAPSESYFLRLIRTAGRGLMSCARGSLALLRGAGRLKRARAALTAAGAAIAAKIRALLRRGAAPAPPARAPLKVITGRESGAAGRVETPDLPAAGGEEDVEDIEPLEEEDGAPAAAKAALTIRLGADSEARPSSKKGAGSQKRGGYTLPSIELLDPPPPPSAAQNPEQLKQIAQKIEETLQSFKIDGQVVEIQCGPVITQYEILLAPGIKVHRISNLANELAMALKARRIRIVAPVPGKNTVGIEVPNPQRAIVGLRELLQSDVYRASRHEIPLLLGKDGAGHPVISDLTMMPHVLIAGATGSGKSVCLNASIITSLMTRSPEELKMILVDPKMVELSDFADIPHLLCPVVTDMKKAPAALAWLAGKMEERYEILSQAAVRNIVAFNKLGKKEILSRIEGKLTDIEIEKFPTFLPYIVLIVDELADLMMTGGKDAEAFIIRLAQKSRAVGIHVILATQRPSVDVITGLIKSNMPCRISFQVSSKVDSRTILDRNGAEALLGRGDMLFLPPGASDLRRVQSCFVSDREIRAVVDFVKSQAEAEFDQELQNEPGGAADEPPSERDQLYDEAVRIVLETQRGSATLLQRRLEVGYTRASRLIDMMAEEGILGPFKGSKAREVYYTLEEWESKKARAEG
jgi:S-DNA-T family DNA segregation ATPase FtsK/SpoIIIE